MNNDQKDNEDRPGVTGKNEAAKEADGSDPKAVPESRNADAGGAGNSGKRARVFDLNAIFEETKKAAQVRGAETAAKREADEAAAEARGDRHPKSHPLGSAQSASGRSAESSQSGGGASGVDSGNATGADSDDDDFMPMLPPGFKPDTTVMEGADGKASSSAAAAESDDDDDEFDDYNGEGIPIEQLIPAQFEASLKHGKKPVTCVAFDMQGLRLASGGADYVVNLFDFMKMDMMLRPERDMTPCESHVINSLSFNHNGEYLVVASGEPQLRILDRKGKQWAETIRGDQYLVDLSNTKGHTATINAIHFNPLIKQEFMTCSDDGTMRLWSLDDFKVLTKCINKHQKVIKTKTAGGKRAMPQCCAYSPDGKIVAAGCDDGSVQAWKYGTMYVNTLFLARTAHKGPITGIAFSPDSKRIVSRGLDDALRLWDVKQPKKFLHEVTGLENGWRNTDVGYSPRGEFIYTGTSAPPDSQTPGKLLFFNAENLELVYRIEFPGVSCIRIEWHARLNQILVGLSDGTMRVYYDQKLSQKGVMTCVTRPIRRKRTEEVVREEFVLSPLSLDMFQPRGEEGEEKEVTPWRIKKFLRIRDNKLRPEFRKPADMPLSGPSAGGKIAKSGSTLHSYLAQQIGTERNREFLEDTDVRASILRHAEEAEKNPQYISKAYRKTQPVPIFAEKTTAPEEEEADDELAPVFKMPKLA